MTKRRVSSGLGGRRKHTVMLGTLSSDSESDSEEKLKDDKGRAIELGRSVTQTRVYATRSHSTRSRNTLPADPSPTSPSSSTSPPIPPDPIPVRSLKWTPPAYHTARPAPFAISQSKDLRKKILIGRLDTRRGIPESSRPVRVAPREKIAGPPPIRPEMYGPYRMLALPSRDAPRRVPQIPPVLYDFRLTDSPIIQSFRPYHPVLLPPKELFHQFLWAERELVEQSQSGDGQKGVT